MTHEEVKALVEEMGLPYAYDHFAEGESPDPPFICFLYPKAENFGADNLVYHHFNRLDIEVYTDYKDPDMEASIEEVLTAHELYYEKIKELEDPEQKRALIVLTANHMKKSFLTWNKDSVEDEQIYNDINTLCGCTVILPEGMTLSNPKDLLQKKSKPSSNKPMNKNYQKNNNNNNNKGNNNRQYYKKNG